MSSISKPLAIVVQMLLIFGALAGLMTGAGANEGKAGGRAVTLIHNVYELQNMSRDLNGSYALANDIDASVTAGWNDGRGFLPIEDASVAQHWNSTNENYIGEFNGEFDGRGFSISGLYISNENRYPNCSFIGLFSLLNTPARVSNLTLSNVDIHGEYAMGALAGMNCQGVVTNCHVSGSVIGTTTGAQDVGLLIGQNSGLISNCSSAGSVQGNCGVGGLVGTNGNYNGLYQGVMIKDCFSTASINNSPEGIWFGGLVGWNEGNITDCYSVGPINGYNPGGLVGGSAGNVSDCYWDIQTSGTNQSSGGTGMNTSDMMLKSTFADWDFTNTWDINENATYPYLRDMPFPGANHAPTITTSPVTAAIVDNPYSVQYQATDPDGDSLSWNMTSNASWLTMTNAGLLSGTPSSADLGTFVVAITVSDGKEGTASLTFELSVSAKHLISWTEVPGDVNLTEGDNYTFAAKAIDSNPENILEYSVNSTGNSNLTVNSSTGAIQWLNVTAGNHSFTLSATDGVLTIGHDFVLSVARKVEPYLAPYIVSVTGPENITVKASSVQTFSVEATSPSGANLTYEWKENGAILGTGKTFSQKFPPGTHILILLIGDGRYTTTRTFNFTVAPVPKTIDTRPVPIPGFEAGVAAAAVIAVVAIGLIFAAGTEVGKYRLLLVLFLPLYTRLHKEEVLDNEMRGMIRGCIFADPGVHYNEIIRRLRLHNGAAAHHLMTLEREGIIRSRNDGRLKRFYPADMKLSEAPPMLDRFQRTIYDALREKDGMSQREIARALDVSFSSVNRHINRMASMGVVRLERQGMSMRCYLVNGVGMTKTDEPDPSPSVRDQPPEAR